MHLDAQGKTKDVPEVAIAITYETHGIDIIGSQLIKERDALDALTHIVRDIVSEALTQGYVRTDAGRERIIAVFILRRLLGPEIMSEDGIEIDAALQRFKPPSLTDITVPGNEILLDRECQFRIVRIKTGNISELLFKEENLFTDEKEKCLLIIDNLITVAFWSNGKYIILVLRSIAYLIIHRAITIHIGLLGMMSMTIETEHQTRELMGIIVEYLSHIVIKLL